MTRTRRSRGDARRAGHHEPGNGLGGGDRAERGLRHAHRAHDCDGWRAERAPTLAVDNEPGRRPDPRRNRRRQERRIRWSINTARPRPSSVAVLEWVASIGAVTAEALAELQGSTIASARGQLAAAERSRHLSRHRPLAAHPSLYTITRAGLAHCRLRGVEPCRVSAANAIHLITCAWAAARLARSYPDQRVAGERELRRDERARRYPLASALLPGAHHAQARPHRPDLVLWPDASAGWSAGRSARLPVAIEVELTLKAPQRLAEICRAWARCRDVAGVIYIAAPTGRGCAAARDHPGGRRRTDRGRRARRPVEHPRPAPSSALLREPSQVGP